MPDIPEGAKKPADRAAKAEAKKEPTAVEFDGVTYRIDSDVLEDVEVLELIADMQSNYVLLVPCVRAILGKEQWAAFKDSHRDDNGRVSIEALGKLFEVIDEAVGN